MLLGNSSKLAVLLYRFEYARATRSLSVFLEYGSGYCAARGVRTCLRPRLSSVVMEDCLVGRGFWSFFISNWNHNQLNDGIEEHMTVASVVGIIL